MDSARLETMQKCFGIDDATHRSLQQFYDTIQCHVPSVVGAFFETILRDPEVSRHTAKLENSRHCLEQSLTTWLCSTLAGPHEGAEFFESRQRIGRVHVHIDLPQELMLLAMNCIRERLLGLAFSAPNPLAERITTVGAINRALDFELALILDSYREHQQSQLKASERLATIGQLAASIGHELRNPLGTLETSLFLITQKMETQDVTDEGITRHLEKARRQVQLCARITNDLLELARSRAPKRQVISVSAVVEEALDAVTFSPGVTRNLSVDASLVVCADQQQLRSVLVNLLENARDAVVDEGCLDVTAYRFDRGVTICVSDSGPGIAKGERSHVFEPLYTTKPNGNGLGLALCRRIMLAHGGTIELKNSPKGARFCVWLPDGEPGTPPLHDCAGV